MKRMTAIILVSLMLVSTLLLFSSCSKKRYNPYIINGMTIVFWGDSITDCMRNRDDETDLGSEWTRSHVIQVSECIKDMFYDYDIRVRNLGFSGYSIQEIANTIDQVKAVEPSLVILLAGVNDVNKGLSQSATRAGITAAINNIKTNLPDCTLVICEPFMIPTTEAMEKSHEKLKSNNEVIKQIALENNCIFVPLDDILNEEVANGLPPKSASPDGIHLATIGYDIISEQICKAIDIPYLTEIELGVNKIKRGEE